MRTRIPLLFTVALVATALGCATARPQYQAGSTEILRLLRDWRGTWMGQVSDSPMGKMSYTLYVEEAGPSLRLRMARPKEPDLDTVSQRFDFYGFIDGSPSIGFVLSQRGSTQTGRLTYREEHSSEREAVFCPKDHGCEKLLMAFAWLGPQELVMRTMVDEAPHSEIQLAWASAEVPDIADEPPPAVAREPIPNRTYKKPAPAKAVPAAVDEDVWLEENVDRDVAHEHLDKDIVHEHIDQEFNAPDGKPEGKKIKGGKKR